MTFSDWLLSAAPGDRLTYHTGCLVEDRERDKDLSRTATLVSRAAEDGLVILFQQRAGDGFVYVAQRARGKK